MRAAIGIISLLLALAVAGLLAKKQLSATRAVLPALQPATGATGTQDAAPSTVRAQSHQVQQQYQRAVDGLMQARPCPMENNKTSEVLGLMQQASVAIKIDGYAL